MYSSWSEHYHDDERHVWLPQPSIHALSPPPIDALHIRDVPLPRLVLDDDKYNPLTTKTHVLRQSTTDDDDVDCIPRTITIPTSVPVTPESIRTTVDLHQDELMSTNER